MPLRYAEGIQYILYENRNLGCFLREHWDNASNLHKHQNIDMQTTSYSFGCKNKTKQNNAISPNQFNLS